MLRNNSGRKKGKKKKTEILKEKKKVYSKIKRESISKAVHRFTRLTFVYFIQIIGSNLYSREKKICI